MSKAWSCDTMASDTKLDGRKHIALFLLGFVSLLGSLAGCRVPLPDVKSMIPEALPSCSRFGEEVHVRVLLSPDNPLASGCDKKLTGEGLLNVGRFTDAVNISILRSGLFDAVVLSPEVAQFNLEIEIIHVEGKPGRFDLSTSKGIFVARWKLEDASKRLTYFDEQVSSIAATSGGGNIYRPNRTIAAAARANIDAGIRHLAKLPRPKRVKD